MVDMGDNGEIADMVQICHCGALLAPQRHRRKREYVRHPQ
jgi:hypothetical protein